MPLTLIKKKNNSKNFALLLTEYVILVKWFYSRPRWSSGLSRQLRSWMRSAVRILARAIFSEKIFMNSYQGWCRSSNRFEQSKLQKGHLEEERTCRMSSVGGIRSLLNVSKAADQGEMERRYLFQNLFIRSLHLYISKIIEKTLDSISRLIRHGLMSFWLLLPPVASSIIFHIHIHMSRLFNLIRIWQHCICINRTC